MYLFGEGVEVRVHQQVEHQVAEEGRSLFLKKFHSHQQLLCYVNQQIFAAIVGGMVEYLSPEDVSLFLLDAFNQLRIVLLHKLNLHDLDVFLNEFIPDDLVVHLEDNLLEVVAKNWVSLSFFEPFSLENLEDFFKGIDVFVFNFGRLVNDGFLNKVLHLPETVSGWLFEEKRRDVVLFGNVFRLDLSFIAVNDWLIKEKVEFHDQVDNQHIFVTIEGWRLES